MDALFHEGERTVQQRAGETALADRNAVVIGDTVIAGARTFIAKQFMAVVGSVDAAGRVWASLLFGQPGFMHAEEGKSIMIDLPIEERDRADPVWPNIAVNPGVGMLFIDLGTRRRYRVNGNVVRNHGARIEVAVREAYPNCPKYIQRRHLRDMGPLAHGPVVSGQGTGIDGAASDILRGADTLFVASHHAQRGVDASHRGGAPGFVTIIGERTMRIPDYQGNSLFNTLGNFEIDGRAGVCVPDFDNKRLLHMTGRATIRWDLEDPDGHTGGTGRYWDFEVDEWTVHATPRQLEWEFLDPSPFNLRAGTPYRG